MPGQRATLRRLRATVDLWVDCFSRHNLLTYASAIALRALVALIPLTLLGLAMLGAFGLKSVWRDQLAPPIHDRFTHATYSAIDSAVQRILSHGTLGLLAFAALLTVWDVSSAVRACMGALTTIYEQKDERSARRRFGISVALGVAITVCVVAAVLAVTAGRRIAEGDTALAVSVGIARWAVAIVLLTLAVGLLVQFAPARRRAESWVGLGTAVVVLSWVVMSVVFVWFVSSVANFRTAPGQLAVFLVLTTYVYLSAIVFLVGVELDERLRKGAPGQAHGVLARRRGLAG
jgi:membrane protein